MARLMSFGDAPPPPPQDDSRSASDDPDAPSLAPRVVKKRRKRRKALTTEEDIAILRAVAEVKPHHAAHGQGRRRWQEAADRVVAECGGELSATLCKGRFDNMLKRFVQEQETGGLWPRDATRRELVMAALEDQKALGDKVLRPENGASWKKRMLEMDLRRDDATAEPHDKPKDKPLTKKPTSSSPQRANATTASARSTTSSPAPSTIRAASGSSGDGRQASQLRTVLTPPRHGMSIGGRGGYVITNRMGGSPAKNRAGPPHPHDRPRMTPPTRPAPMPDRPLPSLPISRPSSASSVGPNVNKNGPSTTSTSVQTGPGRPPSTTTTSLQKVVRSQPTSLTVPANLLWPLYNPAPLANRPLPWNVVRANAINMINGNASGSGAPPQSGPPQKTGPPPPPNGPQPPTGSAPPASSGSDDRDRSRLPSVASVAQSAHQILVAARSEAPVPTILKSSTSRAPPSQPTPTSSSPRAPPPQPHPTRSPPRPPADSVHPVPTDSMPRREGQDPDPRHEPHRPHSAHDQHRPHPAHEQHRPHPAQEVHLPPVRHPSASESPNERRSFVESALFTMLDRLTEMEKAWLRDRDQDRELRRRAAAANRSPRGDGGGYEPSDVSREEFDEVVLEMAASRRERAELKQEVASLSNSLARSEYEQSMMREQIASLASLVRESRRENYELKQDVGSLASMLREVTGHSGALRELEAAQQRQAEELRRYQQDEESRRRVTQIDDRARYETLEQRLEQLERGGDADNQEPQGEPSSGEEDTEGQPQLAAAQHPRTDNSRGRSRAFNPFAELQATMEKQQELIKLYEQAQTMQESHSRTELEIAELKTVIDVERVERTREYMSLLDNIKRVLAVDGPVEERA